MSAGRRGVVVLRVEGALFYVPAAVALRVALTPRVTAVPGAPAELVGVALHEGTILPVIAVGPARGEMVVCQHAGELVGVVGGSLVRTGTFEPVGDRPDAIAVDGETARPLDVATIYARVQSDARGARWIG